MSYSLNTLKRIMYELPYGSILGYLWGYLAFRLQLIWSCVVFHRVKRQGLGTGSITPAMGNQMQKAMDTGITHDQGVEQLASCRVVVVEFRVFGADL